MKDAENLSYSEWVGRLNEYLRLLAVLLNPNLIILGGGISADHDDWFKLIDVPVEVVPARFLNEAGIVGSALAAER